MTSLVEFLLARIAEDEAVATAAETEPKWFGLGDDAFAEMLYLARGEGAQDTATAHAERYSPKRISAECAAKRKIIDAYVDERSRRDIYQSDEGRAAEMDETVDQHVRERQVLARRSAAARCRGLEIAVEALARVYADHPDYREEWRA